MLLPILLQIAAIAQPATVPAPVSATAAAEQGIQGVPFFVFDNRLALSGAQPAEVFERALRIAIGDEPMPS